ncbi:polysaccharide deacetylase family protein [Sphingomonas sp. G-3-2-10]|uniref:polysaccharide deacetylase family protein n=1 Tax=Sphingomonas sp. G-3-2-10 TaxID=2728838 RepID=UPI00146E6C28|nr:polysaccharide deacetylase family protein [Sphingomonas sp. G-3-2-10]NML05332.1 polysaccharide deacetylase family protein [Sphingomonas sp. G-3-2-10]
MARFLTRRHLALAGLVLVLLLACLYALFEISRAKCWQLVGTPVCRVDTQEKLVALTFDDGPTRGGVDAVLPILAAHDAHATFFLIGNDLARNPGQARRLLDAGHELGNHSYTHGRMWGLFPGGYEDEVRRTDALLRAEGAAPAFFRPPYGKRLTGLPIAVDRTGYRTIMWTFEDPMAETDPRRYADTILSQIRPGAVVIMHVMYRGNQVARDALPLILEGLKVRGYRAVSVGELLKHEGR